MNAPRIVRLPDGTHWVVNRGVGHQITGDRQLLWARIIYGEVVEQDAADWSPGPGLLELMGGPGGIEKVARGEVPDPFAHWLVTTSTPNNVYADARLVRSGSSIYLVLASGGAYLADGPGQVRSLIEIYGEPAEGLVDPAAVLGKVAGAGESDLFKPNEIEVLSGLTPQVAPQVDGTTGDDDVSIQLPRFTPPAPVGPLEPGDPDAASLADQALGASGDRTPGLASPLIPVADPPPVAAPDQAGAATSPPQTRPTGNGTSSSPPQTRPTEGGPPQTSVQVRPTEGGGPSVVSQVRPTGNGPVYTSPPQVRPNPAAALVRPPAGGTVPSAGGRNTFSSAGSALFRPRPLPAPSFPVLRSWLTRSNQDAGWLDLIERRNG